MGCDIHHGTRVDGVAEIPSDAMYYITHVACGEISETTVATIDGRVIAGVTGAVCAGAVCAGVTVLCEEMYNVIIIAQ